MKQLSLSAIGTFVVAFSFVSFSSSLLASEKKTPTHHPHYPNNFANHFIDECMSHASEHEETADFLQPDQVDELCHCTLNQFQTKYTYSQYQTLSRKEKEKEGYVCVDRLLYEEKSPQK